MNTPFTKLAESLFIGPPPIQTPPPETTTHTRVDFPQIPKLPLPLPRAIEAGPWIDTSKNSISSTIHLRLPVQIYRDILTTPQTPVTDYLPKK